VRLSLVLATVERTEEVDRFLDSVAIQGYRDLEVIIVDQNSDDRLGEILPRYSRRQKIVHLRSARGASRARTLGLEAATGDLVGFPDDDCWYPSGLLTRVGEFFEHRPDHHGISGRTEGPDGSTVVGRFSDRPGLVSKLNIWTRMTMAALFLRRSVTEAVGPFDESLGPGAGTPWGAGEDIDYPLRALELGFRIYYHPDLRVGHPDPATGYEGAALRRAQVYGRGMGRVLRRHRYPLWFVGYQLVRPLGGSLVALAIGRPDKSRYHWKKLQGRVEGWRSSSPR
jgi:glycosyltransferase involved in cell wall biosynthesis